MSEKLSDASFIVWATDRKPHGPMNLVTLVSWVKCGRVVGGTWIFLSQGGVWERASEVAELQMFFQSRQHQPALSAEAFLPGRNFDVRAMRQLKLLSYLTDDQLERFAGYVVGERMPPKAIVVKQGDAGNAMYLILEGELSVRMIIGGLEMNLATLGMGDFFGDFALFDHGPRSASVVADASCLLLKISIEAFERLAHDAPDLATPFLRAIAKTLTARIRAGNKHHGETVKFARALQ